MENYWVRTASESAPVTALMMVQAKQRAGIYPWDPAQRWHWSANGSFCPAPSWKGWELPPLEKKPTDKDAVAQICQVHM